MFRTIVLLVAGNSEVRYPTGQSRSVRQLYQYAWVAVKLSHGPLWRHSTGGILVKDIESRALPYFHRECVAYDSSTM